MFIVRIPVYPKPAYHAGGGYRIAESHAVENLADDRTENHVGRDSSLDSPEHRLGIGSFAVPLRALLMAARRTANNMIREAVDRKGSEVGRFAAEADRIDIQIVTLDEGSTSPLLLGYSIPAS